MRRRVFQNPAASVHRIRGPPLPPVVANRGSDGLVAFEFNAPAKIRERIRMRPVNEFEVFESPSGIQFNVEGEDYRNATNPRLLVRLQPSAQCRKARGTLIGRYRHILID